jgi:hypothetical protein
MEDYTTKLLQEEIWRRELLEAPEFSIENYDGSRKVELLDDKLVIDRCRIYPGTEEAFKLQVLLRLLEEKVT